MLSAVKRIKLRLLGKKDGTEAVGVKQAMWDNDYLTTKNTFYKEISEIIREGLISSEGFDHLHLGTDVQELHTNLKILIQHSDSVIDYLEDVKVKPKTPEYDYVVAVMRLFADMTSSMENFISELDIEVHTEEKVVGLQKVTRDYFNFMTSVHDHVQDVKIDSVLKVELAKYYSKYVNSTFFV